MSTRQVVKAAWTQARKTRRPVQLGVFTLTADSVYYRGNPGCFKTLYHVHRTDGVCGMSGSGSGGWSYVDTASEHLAKYIDANPHLLLTPAEDR